MVLDFKVRFIINRVDGIFKIELTDQTVYSLAGVVKGFYRITYPDGVFVENTDQNNPDFDLDNPVALLNLRLVNVRPIKGSYTIVQKIYVDNTLFTEEKQFTYSFDEPQLILIDNSNTGTPQVSFRDTTDTSVDDYTIDSLFRDITSDFPEGIALPPLSTSEEMLLMGDSGSYYEGIYNPTLTWQIDYLGTGHGVYLEYSKEFQFDIRRVLQFNELVQLLNLLKERLDSASGQERSKLEQMYQQLVSLYSHVIAKTRASESDVRGLIDEMQRIAYMACCYCVKPEDYEYSTNPLEPFEDKIFEFVRRQVFEYDGNNTFELSLTPLKIFQVFRNGKLMVLEDVEYEIDGRNVTILEPMVIGDEIVIFYTLQENTYILNLEDYAERAEAAALASEQSAVNSLASEQNASQSASDADLSAQAAAQSAIDADQEADLARRWASEDEDVVVANGEFSSKHYSLKSAQSASDSQDSADDSANSAAAALQSEQNAALSEAAALLSEQNALASEQAAQGFAQDASDTLDLIAPAVSQGIDDINDAKDAALIDITSAESSVLGNITQAESDALSDISDAKDQAVQDVADATQDAVDAANTSTQQAILSAAARDDAEAAKLAAEGFADAAEGFKDDAESASVLSTDQAILSAAARDAAEGYKNTANAERLLAEDARDASEGFRDEAEGFKDESEDAKDEAELFANIATQAIGALSSTGTLMQFNRDRIYGFPTAESGNITVDNTTATQGVVVLMRHNDVAEPSYPANFTRVAGNYVDATDNLLNVICVYVDTANTANNIYYLNIINL
jgi:hypothetical protein